MRILFVTGRAHLPQSVGGVQSSTETTIQVLEERGHVCAVACALWGGNELGLGNRIRLKLSRGGFVKDTVRGYPVYRAWEPLDKIVGMARAFRPDVAVVQHQKTVPFVQALDGIGIPVAVYLRNLEYHELCGDLRTLPDTVRYIGNSVFTSTAYREKFGIDPIVLPPLIEPSRYCTEGRGKNVLMINPSEEKGIHITLEVAARCPDIPFLIVRSWGLPDYVEPRIEAINAAGGKITLVDSTHDMKSIYAQARILMAPSQWEEAWGRVASEAHVSGIPVLGSDRGGLPEAIGPGGIILPHDAPIEEWTAALRRLWNEEDTWNSCSRAASQYALRAEMQLEGHVDRLLETMTLCQQGATARARTGPEEAAISHEAAL